MNPKSNVEVSILLATLVGLATFLTGCSNQQESARKELAKLGKDFSPTVFMGCIRDGDNWPCVFSFKQT
jgi:hypothetical protein